MTKPLQEEFRAPSAAHMPAAFSATRRRVLSAAAALCVGGLASGALWAAQSYRPDFPLGRPANVILVVEGEYARFREVLVALCRGFAALGLIPPLPDAVTPEGESTWDVWDAVAQTTQAGRNAPAASGSGRRLNFLVDGHYSYAFDPRRSADVRRAVAERADELREADLILTLGNLPAKELPEVVREVPIVALAVEDPVEAGIIPAAGRSGRENLHVTVVEDRFGRQTRVFHAVKPFRKLALLTSRQRLATAGEAEIREACRALGSGFTTVLYDERGDGSDDDFKQFMEGLREVAALGCDAVMLPWFSMPDEQFADAVDFMTANGIASFSQIGGDFVARGVLLGAGRETLEGYGLFEADVVAKILAGEAPNMIRQTFQQRSAVVLNLASAMQMGWRPNFGLLVSLERAYTTQSR